MTVGGSGDYPDFQRGILNVGKPLVNTASQSYTSTLDFGLFAVAN